MPVAFSDNGQIIVVVLGFVGIAVVIRACLTLVSWAIGRLGLFKRAGRRFDALDDAVESELSDEEKFRLDVAMQERTRGHSTHTR